MPTSDTQLSPARFPNLESAYVALLRLVEDDHQFHIAPRGNDAREVVGVSFQITDPRQRLPYVAVRKANPVFHYAEALWYLSGRNDLEMISHYAPSMAAFSRDGQTIQGSSYGWRMFNPVPGQEVSAFDRVMELLRRETDSKRGFIPVLTADELAVENNPDMACLSSLHLLPRDGQLHMVCTMRANDLDCGLLSDVFSFTMIQEYAAIQLGLDLGVYIHHIGSAHVNDNDADRVRLVLEEAGSRKWQHAFRIPSMPRDTTKATIETVMEHEALLRTNAAKYSAEDIAGLGLHLYWQQALLLFEIHRQVKVERVAQVDPSVLAGLDSGLRWLVRKLWTACTTAVTA